MARGYTSIPNIVKICREELIDHLGNDVPTPPDSEAAASSDASEYVDAPEDTAGDVWLDADSSVEDLQELSVDQTYKEYMDKLDNGSPENTDHLIHVLGVMRAFKMKPGKSKTTAMLEDSDNLNQKKRRVRMRVKNNNNSNRFREKHHCGCVLITDSASTVCVTCVTKLWYTTSWRIQKC